MPSTEKNIQPIPRPDQTSGLAAAISEGSAVTDNLASLMKNSVVIFESTLTVLSPPAQTKQGEDPADV